MAADKAIDGIKQEARHSMRWHTGIAALAHAPTAHLISLDVAAARRAGQRRGAPPAAPALALPLRALRFVQRAVVLRALAAAAAVATQSPARARGRLPLVNLQLLAPRLALAALFFFIFLLLLLLLLLRAPVQPVHARAAVLRAARAAAPPSPGLRPRIVRPGDDDRKQACQRPRAARRRDWSAVKRGTGVYGSACSDMKVPTRRRAAARVKRPIGRTAVNTSARANA